MSLLKKMTPEQISYLGQFKPVAFSRPIECSGRFIETPFTGTGKWEVNYSSILTKLIFLAGRYCERFASDLFITWRTIDDLLASGEMEDASYLFGFRGSGVDCNTFIFSRYLNTAAYGNVCGEVYRSLRRLDITVNDNDIKMSLYEVEKDFTLKVAKKEEENGKT